MPSPVFKPLFEDLVSVVEVLEPASVPGPVPHAVRVPRRCPSSSRCCRSSDSRGRAFEGPGQPVAALRRAVPARVLEVAGVDRARAQPAVRRARAATSIGSSSGSCPRTRRAYRMLARGRSRRDEIDTGLKEQRGSDAGIRGVLPTRRVLRPRLQLHRAQQPVAALLRRPRAPGADDAARPRVDRPRPLPRLRARHLGSLGAGLARLRRGRRAAAVRPGDGGAAARRGRLDATRTATGPARGTAARSTSSSSCRRASRSAARSTRRSRRSSRSAGVDRARPADGVGGLRRADRRGRLRGRLARVVGASDPNPDPYFYWHSSQCAPAESTTATTRTRRRTV